MQTILTVLQVFLSLGLIGLILIQHGKGADAGAAFGSGASATVFGARGSGSFLTRATAILATLFFLTSMGLAYYATQVSEPKTIMDRVEQPAPVVPAPISDIPAVPGAEGAGEALVAPSDVPADIAIDGESATGESDGSSQGSVEPAGAGSPEEGAASSEQSEAAMDDAGGVAEESSITQESATESSAPAMPEPVTEPTETGLPERDAGSGADVLGFVSDVPEDAPVEPSNESEAQGEQVR